MGIAENVLFFGVLSITIVKGSSVPTLPELANNYGFQVEEHEVKTEDGYFLRHFRIPPKNSFLKNATIPVVLLVHGIHTHSDIWTMLGEKTLVFMLVEEGYDVWVGNTRGNKYSQRHEFLNPNDVEFWNHSWHEVGVYDLPVTIDYILDKTGNEHLSYIGLSTGNTACFVMLSEKPQYNEKIVTVVSYGPVVFWKNTKSNPLRLFSLFATDALEVVESLRLMDILSSQGPTIEYAKKTCLAPPIFQFLCSPLLLLTFGPRKGNQNDDMITEFVTNIGATSLKQIVHSVQHVHHRTFQQFKNQSNMPPKYNLKNVHVPVALYSVESDFLADKQDVDILQNELPNVVLRKEFPFAYYGFLSYYLSEKAPEVLYEHTLLFLRSILTK